MTKLVLTRGLPGSGKTTLARKWVADAPETRTRVNRDDTRMMIYGDYVPAREREETITTAQHAQVFALLTGGRDVIVDDTNLNARFFKQWLRLAEKASASVEVIDVTTPLAICLERNETREKRVDPNVISSFAHRFLRDGVFPQIPTLEESTPVFAPYVPDTMKPRAWIVDIDGTMAKMDGRGPYDYARVGEDLVNEPVREIVASLREQDTADNHPVSIILLSGRSDECRSQTEAWLARHGVEYDQLLMRRAGDFRRDSIVKGELFDNHLRGEYWVVGAIDDRDQVVKLWRDAGIFCAQVDYGSF